MKKKLLSIILVGILTLSPATVVCADEKDDRIAELEMQIQEMQKTIDNLNQKTQRIRFHKKIVITKIQRK